MEVEVPNDATSSFDASTAASAPSSEHENMPVSLESIKWGVLEDDCASSEMTAVDPTRETLSGVHIKKDAHAKHKDEDSKRTSVAHEVRSTMEVEAVANADLGVEATAIGENSYEGDGEAAPVSGPGASIDRDWRRKQRRGKAPMVKNRYIS